MADPALKFDANQSVISLSPSFLRKCSPTPVSTLVFSFEASCMLASHNIPPCQRKGQAPTLNLNSQFSILNSHPSPTKRGGEIYQSINQSKTKPNHQRQSKPKIQNQMSPNGTTHDHLPPSSNQAAANPDATSHEEVERTKLSLLRYSVERQDPSCKEVDDGTLRRFLRARDLDVEKASAMFLKYLNWQRTFLPANRFISTSDISTDISQNKVFLQGTDRTGRPVCVAFGGRHFQNKLPGGVDQLKRFVVFVIHKLCSSMAEGQEKFVVIGDLEGWGYANSDIRGYLAALHILQDYYPERLGKLFIVHVPYVFMAVWKVIYPFIDSNTKKKIVFVENKKLKSTLVEDIDESQLPEIYGGKLPLVPIHQA